MSLQVWLPLNGNLNNQGLSDVNIINNGATVNNNGKIGKCYSFNGSSSFLSIPAVLNATNQNFSICAWMKFNSTSGTYTLYTSRTAVGEGLAIFRISGNKIRFDDGGLQTTFDYECNTTWTHICVTRDIQSKKLYINGELKQTVLSVGQMTNLYSGNGSIGASTASGSGAGNYLNGNINDFRIYDHCLSKKEVKEIAKGLVVHYKLCGKTGVATNENLISGNYSVQWQNGIRTVSGSAKLNLTEAEIRALKGTKYTFSYDLCRTNAGQRSTTEGLGWGENRFGIHLSLVYKDANGTSHTTYPCASALERVYEGRVSMTETFPSDYNSGLFGFGIQPYAQPNDDSIWYIKNLKFELGDKATPWIPSVLDSNSTMLGLNDDIEYDCSGFENNGTKIGNLITNLNSRRYEVSNYFDGGQSYINSSFAPKLMEEFSSSCWFKMDSTGRRNVIYSNYAGDNNSSFIEIEISNAGVRVHFSDDNKKTISWTPYSGLIANIWYFLGVTYKNHIFSVYLYNDSTKEYKTASQTYSDFNLISSNYDYTYIGKMTVGTDMAMLGNISDLRFYSTCLNEDEIVELYEVGASIAKGDTLWGYELVEG